MRQILFVLLLTITASLYPQTKTEIEKVTEKIISRLEILEENYLTKLNRRDFGRARMIVDEIYAYLDDLRNPDVLPMNEISFQNLKSAIQEESFSSNRIDIIKTAAEKNNFTVHQVIEITGLMTYSEERVSTIRILYPWIIDKENSMLLFNAMTFASEKEEIKEIIEGYNR
jgi:predicted RND superfamily exporter protein